MSQAGTWRRLAGVFTSIRWPLIAYGVVWGVQRADPNRFRDPNCTLESRRDSCNLRRTSSTPLSPDGRWLAYFSNQLAKYEVYVRAFPDKGEKWQILNAGGSSPVWSRNGRELFFRSEDNRVMVATYTAKGDSLVPDKPRSWSGKQLADVPAVGSLNFDLAPDGKRVAALIPVEMPGAKSRNLPAELRR